MKVIQHAIKTLDLFGPQIYFTINGKEKFKTVFGGFISLFVYCLYVGLFILFGQDMLFRLNPNVTLEYLMPEEQENYRITNQTFIAWRLESSSQNESELHDTLKCSLYYFEYNNHNKSYIYAKQFQSLNCTDTRFNRNFEHTIHKAEEWKCFDFSTISSQNIYGSESSSIMSFFTFTMDICDIDF